ncbi:MAG: hypothetical protein NVS2B16_37230 [Chloroflexota bacterium]
MTTTPPTGCLSVFAQLFSSTRQPPALPVDRASQTAEAVAIRYRLRDDFLSRAEASFFHVVRQVLPEHYTICPKVNLQDLFYVPKADDDVTARNRINRKHVDFLVCDVHTLRPVAGIELDDRSHQRPDRQARDLFVEQVFAAAGLPLIRVPVQAGYTTGELTALLTAVIQATPAPESVTEFVPAMAGRTPSCPVCGSAMVLQTAKSGANTGGQFYGCSNYPQCRGLQPATGHPDTAPGPGTVK